MPDSQQIAVRNRNQPKRGRKVIYLNRTEYSTTDEPPVAPPRPNVHSDDDSGGRTLIVVPKNKTQPAKPAFLGNQRTILIAWLVALVFVSLDEWKRFGVLPRPARLWWTTLVYAILAVISGIGPVMPLANVMAIGYTIVVMWQYFNKEGQFS